MKQNQSLLRRPSVQALFNGYYYDDQLAAINQDQSAAISSEPEISEPGAAK